MTDYRKENRLLREIAQRASALYERIGQHVDPLFIQAEIAMVHREIVPLRLEEMANADDGNFAHDIGGIHRHLDMVTMTLTDCFSPRFTA